MTLKDEFQQYIDSIDALPQDVKSRIHQFSYEKWLEEKVAKVHSGEGTKYKKEYDIYVEELSWWNANMQPKTYQEWLESEREFVLSGTKALDISYDWNKELLGAHESTIKMIKHIFNSQQPTFYEIEQFITLLDSHVEEINERFYKGMENKNGSSNQSE